MQMHVIGAGFFGLAVSWFLLERGHHVTLYDPKGIGGGASGMAAGLLHPYSSGTGKIHPLGMEGLKETYALIDIAETALGRPVADRSGLIRMGVNFPNLIPLSQAEKETLFPGVAAGNAYRLQGATVDCKAYLQGLWKACEAQGATFRQEAVHTLPQESTIVTAGYESLQFGTLPLRPLKGQLLEIEHRPLKVTLNGPVYCTPGSPAWLGATFERGNADPNVDLAEAKRLLLPKYQTLFPGNKLEIIGARGGIRATTPNRLPLLQQIAPRAWALTGLGSKGLLLHAFFAKRSFPLQN